MERSEYFTRPVQIMASDQAFSNFQLSFAMVLGRKTRLVKKSYKSYADSQISLVEVVR